MNEVVKRMTQKRVMTPLWIIALFVSLSETVLGVAVTQTTGGIQVALTTFVIGFPVLVAAAFFAILWDRPYVLYPPTEYGGGTDVTGFVEAMQRRMSQGDRLYAEIQQAVRGTLTSSQLVTELRQVLSEDASRRGEEQIGRILDIAVEKTVDRIREVGFLTIDVRPLFGTAGRQWRVPYDRYRTVSELLNDIFYLIGSVPPYSYGEAWVLRDSASGRLFTDMGTRWASGSDARGKRRADIRSLEEVGVVPGMSLEVISPPKKRTVDR